MKKKTLYLWYRIGDTSEYLTCGDDFYSLIDTLNDSSPGSVTSWGERGKLYTNNYSGLNYISLYWGDGNGEFERDLNKNEKKIVAEGLGVD